eukprot:CAMPEP_0180169832 /NCGR_PEP_ID=MMETSP0986-20121125/33489_1 /TAXON_ID=697907 /ORGANISM="non described non described, Strain CCMP2293" /LENGTH=83 /DNA_ID=CAMNT_0022121453 /DNA_START=290 /DNA_END=537 /DNA_ORIENTATION=-
MSCNGPWLRARAAARKGLGKQQGTSTVPETAHPLSADQRLDAGPSSASRQRGTDTAQPERAAKRKASAEKGSHRFLMSEVPLS